LGYFPQEIFSSLLEVLDDLCELMLHGSLCALGGLTPYPVLSAIKHFPEDFHHVG
jgi:formate dehydrogenase iron-sulfur subunit